MSDTYKGRCACSRIWLLVYPFTENLLTLNKLYAKVSNLLLNDKALGKEIGKKILDPRINIVNYTSLPEVPNGTKLMGAYSIDADGIKPEAEIPLDRRYVEADLNRATPTEHAHALYG